ncbi:D-amino-acid transaminase [Cohnella lubricantis]|uniref:D-alanine aminotransferase n=1 Tax=Cohnella lubricantis TaxID=2163172 RepID=A0A841TB70_9BACL|nr:D-amino-acid transaminase [Cohnella lubricantis]MBB6677275.1 D-amino-acid transaminase [Cohnella lubricantis]MBP2116913.1 D-alanine transaminase [Cohnella lubricantis]
MPSVYWYNGEFIAKEDVRISPDDRGYYFGDGLYEVFRVYAGRIYEAEAHFERLVRTADGLRIALPYTIEAIQQLLEELIGRNGLQEGTVYLQFTRGAAPRSHPFPQGAAPVTMAYCTELPRPLAAMERGIAAVTVPDIRWLRCDFKTLNLLPNTLAKQQALDAGGDDAILHRSGTVTECSASNIMIVRGGTILTHPADNLILHGVTRGVVLRLAREAAIPVEERPFTVDELLGADEAFITGTTVEVTPVVRVDGHAIAAGDAGPVTRRLQEAFAATIR